MLLAIQIPRTEESQHLKQLLLVGGEFHKVYSNYKEAFAKEKRLDQSTSAFHTHTTANVPGGPLE